MALFSSYPVTGAVASGDSFLLSQLSSQTEKTVTFATLTSALLVSGSAVIGPASATNGGFAKYDGISGKLIKDSPAVVGATSGGTDQNATEVGSLLYGSGTNAWSRLAGPTAASTYILKSRGDGTLATAPQWVSTTGSGSVVMSFGATVTGLFTTEYLKLGNPATAIADTPVIGYVILYDSNGNAVRVAVV